MTRTVVTEETDFPIQPQHIDASSRHLWSAFDNHEREVSAAWIVRLCQRSSGSNWQPFTKGDIEGFYNEAGHHRFLFNGLDTEGLVVEDEHGVYRVTDEFVTRCFQSSPKT